MLLTIVVPCYNESARLQREQFTTFAQQHPTVQFLFVNDGSKDDTLPMLQQLCSQNEQLNYLHLPQNSGKAEAVRKGMLHAATEWHTDYIGFWDADLATPLSEINAFLAQFQRQPYQIVTGLRLARLGSGVHRTKMRHHLGRCFASIASIMLQLPVYDTQCGAKIYKTSIITTLFSEPFSTRWLFDVELLARYIVAFGYEAAKTNIYEYPLLTWQEIGGSQLKMKDFIVVPLELLKIKRRYL